MPRPDWTATAGNATRGWLQRHARSARDSPLRRTRGGAAPAAGMGTAGGTGSAWLVGLDSRQPRLAFPTCMWGRATCAAGKDSRGVCGGFISPPRQQCSEPFEGGAAQHEGAASSGGRLGRPSPSGADLPARRPRERGTALRRGDSFLGSSSHPLIDPFALGPAHGQGATGPLILVSLQTVQRLGKARRRWTRSHALCEDRRAAASRPCAGLYGPGTR